jgi:DNA-binding MarR family transcriptional regulator
MAATSKSTDQEKTRIMLGLLDSVDRGSATSQRSLASELGVALGLVNAYLKRCVRKGLVKVRHAPARRYAYYLTPNGFAEKSRLTVEYMSYSFSLFRRAKTDCMDALGSARERGFTRIALYGVSDLAEIATICALDSGVTIVAVVDPHSPLQRFAGAPVMASLDEIAVSADAVLVTDMRAAGAAAKAAVARFGPERVLVPAILGVRPDDQRGAA